MKTHTALFSILLLVAFLVMALRVFFLRGSSRTTTKEEVVRLQEEAEVAARKAREAYQSYARRKDTTPS